MATGDVATTSALNLSSHSCSVGGSGDRRGGPVWTLCGGEERQYEEFCLVMDWEVAESRVNEEKHGSQRLGIR
jgi:hypothetical protein